MRFLVIAALIGLSLAKVDYTGHKVYRAYPNTIQLSLMTQLETEFELDIWSEARFIGDSVDFRVPPELQPKFDVILARNRVSYEIMIEDLQEAINAERAPREEKIGGSFDYSVYHTYDEIDGWIDTFAASDSKVSVVTVGTGKSYESRNMRGVKISTGGLNRNAFVIGCGQHAREWVTPATCMYVANQLLQDYSSGGSVADLMNSVDFYILPTVNPDGYVYTWTDDRMWRKTRTPWRSNNCVASCDGVDPNRNFDAHWSDPGGASTSCCNDAYRGPSAFSEIEVRNQRDFVGSIPNVKGYIDVHAYSQYWMFPYGYTYTHPDDYDLLMEIGQQSIKAIQNVHGKSFTTGSISDVIYLATGSSSDYFYDTQGVKCSFAAELRDKGRYGFQLPESQIIPAAEETYQGLLVIADYIKQGKC